MRFEFAGTLHGSVYRPFPFTRSWHRSAGIVSFENDDAERKTFADFGNTTSAGLVPLTPGAMLAPVPEPGTVLLLARGLAGLALAGRRRV